MDSAPLLFCILAVVALYQYGGVRSAFSPPVSMTVWRHQDETHQRMLESAISWAMDSSMWEEVH
mgnify:FL=1